MISNQSKIMNPTFINYGDQFLSKYFNSQDTLKKSQREDENFNNGSYKYNELIDILKFLEIFLKDKDHYKFNKLDKDLSFRHSIVLQFIKKFRPKWIQRFKFGLDHVIDLKETSPNLYQCLYECGIFSDSISNESKNFITEIKSIVYSDDIHQKTKMILGAFGEELSMKYEQKKTGRRPFHQSLWNDSYGYDIESIDEENNQKRIEVKTSKNGKAFITWNEWKTALSSAEERIKYEFHLWSIKNNQTNLAILRVEDLDFIPQIHQDNHYFDKFIVNFDGFKDKFKNITFEDRL